jgi:hypothetical protein
VPITVKKELLSIVKEFGKLSRSTLLKIVKIIKLNPVAMNNKQPTKIISLFLSR